ncbi:MAG: hypothetical protein H8D23_40135 [Candidatus Brocadiales bacterium]|nr:hypothetical protein [Candidatus Brocadiales bacterium]
MSENAQGLILDALISAVPSTTSTEFPQGLLQTEEDQVRVDENTPYGVLARGLGNYIDPYNYEPRPMDQHSVKDFIKAALSDEDVNFPEEGSGFIGLPGHKERIDLLRIGLGLKQKFNTFEKSKYRPTKGDDPDSFYWDFVNEERKHRITDREWRLEDIYNNAKVYGPDYHNVMGGYTVTDGDGYSSYIDKWDFDILGQGPLEGENTGTVIKGLLTSVLGPGAWMLGIPDQLYKPPKIYGRVYDEGVTPSIHGNIE